uniref:YY1 associated factor 2 n=1 Tax=Sus scrofa TaxID=9823 RepID=A0A8D1HCD7_PIG
MEPRWRRPARQAGVSERRRRLRPRSRPRLPDSPPPLSPRRARRALAGRGSRAWGGGRGGRGRGARARPAGDPAPRRVRVVSCRPKRQPKPSSDEGYWDCSVCTFRNSAEAFKCMMCDVRKGTSTRDSKEGGKLVSYSTASLGVRGTLRNRVGGGSSEEKKQAEYLAPGRRRNIVHRGVGPGQRSGPSLKEA